MAIYKPQFKNKLLDIEYYFYGQTCYKLYVLIPTRTVTQVYIEYFVFKSLERVESKKKENNHEEMVEGK